MPGILNILRMHPRLRWFGLGLLISRIGDSFNTVALAWLSLTIGNAQDLGLVLLCAGLPRMVMSPLAGRALDRFDPKTLLVTDNAARAVIIAAIPTLGWLHLLQVWQLCVIAGVAGAVSSLTDVGENLVAPILVPDAQLEAASGLLSLTYEISALAGPAAAGIVVSVLGYESAFVCDACSFLAMAAGAAILPSLRRPEAPARRGHWTARWVPGAGRYPARGSYDGHLCHIHRPVRYE
jgi:MFS family permease